MEMQNKTLPSYQSKAQLNPTQNIADKQQDHIQSYPLDQSQTYKSFWRIFFNNFAGFLGFMYFGYTLVYVSCVPIWMQKQVYNITLSDTDTITLLSAMIPVGGIAGAFLSIYFIGKLSRRYYMLLICLVSTISLGFIQIPNFPCIIIGKLIQGITVGAECAISPLFISQLSPKSLKGIMGNINQSFIGFGVILAFILSYSINIHLLQIQQIYRLVFAFPAVFIILRLLIICIIFKNQTPTYLLIAKANQEAQELIRQLYEQKYVQRIKKEVQEEIIKSVSTAERGDNTTQGVRIFIGVLINVNQQTSGINVVAVFGGSICQIAVPGYGVLLNIFVMFCQMLGAYTSIFIIKRIGRRSLLHFGTIVSLCTNIALGTAFLPVFGSYALDGSLVYSQGQTIPIMVFMFIYIYVYGMTLGPITFSYIPEICSPKHLPIPIASNWIAGILTIVIFPIVSRYISIAYVFYILAGLCLIGQILNFRYLIQVQGKSQQQIQEQLEKLKLCC